jgi:serine/threonine-protein kinase
MATVYRARDERLKRDVAVKVIADHLSREPIWVRRFRREAELCGGLAHPNIVGVLDAGVTPRDFIVMELIQGIDAAALVQRHGRLAAGHAVPILVQICDALSHAHDRDVVHRDVSPGNILITPPNGLAKLVDFGLSASPIDVAPGQTTSVSGTPGYMAPEILGGSPPSLLSDLYSLGVVAHSLLAGPSEGPAKDSYATAPQATSVARLPALAGVRPDLSPALVEAVEQALAHDPGARQRSVAEFRAQLASADDVRLPVQAEPMTLAAA